MEIDILTTAWIMPEENLTTRQELSFWLRAHSAGLTFYNDNFAQFVKDRKDFPYICFYMSLVARGTKESINNISFGFTRISYKEIMKELKKRIKSTEI